MTTYSATCRNARLYSELSNVLQMRTYEEFFSISFLISQALTYGRKHHAYSHDYRVEFPQNSWSEGQIPVLFLCTVYFLPNLFLWKYTKRSWPVGLECFQKACWPGIHLFMIIYPFFLEFEDQGESYIQGFSLKCIQSLMLCCILWLERVKKTTFFKFFSQVDESVQCAPNAFEKVILDPSYKRLNVKIVMFVSN